MLLDMYEHCNRGLKDILTILCTIAQGKSGRVYAGVRVEIEVDDRRGRTQR